MTDLQPLQQPRRWFADTTAPASSHRSESDLIAKSPANHREVLDLVEACCRVLTVSQSGFYTWGQPAALAAGGLGWGSAVVHIQRSS